MFAGSAAALPAVNDMEVWHWPVIRNPNWRSRACYPSGAVQANAEHLSAELPLERGRSVLYAASAKAGSTLQV